MDVESINRLLDEAVPFSRMVGARVTSVGSEQAEALLPAAPERLNHVGTVHAVAQFGLGEVAAGALILAAFAEYQAQGYVPVLADAAIHYRKPSSGDLRAIARLPAEEQDHIRIELHQTARARFTLPVQLVNSEGAVTTELEVTWVMLQPGV
ncbi:MAG: hypothetical protein OJF49_000028 [Ktedonobacterales bacterium]|jgi:acyl-coenzyme A thioesterase PaaI-like protein|nr:MAG: hypothetical protein OJF49_000028 [Ktedonobacterales bacterium]